MFSSIFKPSLPKLKIGCGLDHFYTGLQTAFSSTPRMSVTTQLLHTIGMPTYAAGMIDSSLSLLGSMGGLGMIRSSQLGSLPSFKLPMKSLLESKGGWVLPKNGGGALIKGRWYTEHALERMAPRTPQVMAELEVRALERTRLKGLQPGTEDFGRWMNRNGPNPRGIPYSVAEAEIAYPGTTDVRVILNESGSVKTVIPRG